MILAVDIGNTNIHNGIFREHRLIGSFSIPTYSKEIKKIYSDRLKAYVGRLNGVIIASVVPSVLERVEKIFKSILDGKILVVGKDIDAGVKNCYKNPKQVGSDRLVNARAAYEIYGGPNIIVDFGTAVTIDIINRHKEYLGGLIVPGVELSVSALSERAALLPKINLTRPKAIIGRDTVESMKSGAIYGFSSLCDGVVDKIKRRYKTRFFVVGTGGMSRLIGPYCRTIDTIDPFLTLKGLEIIWRDCYV